jgi:tRNA threonylcarbamoyladenosine biosynthesis protein TsaE
MELLRMKYGIGNLPALADSILALAGNVKLLTFEGEMGAGKTTLIREICKKIGVIDQVGSPTFSLVNEYFYPQGNKYGIIYHIDLYRIENSDEAKRAGMEECFYSGHYCFVEWPEIAFNIMPKNIIRIKLELDGGGLRMIRVLSGEND